MFNFLRMRTVDQMLEAQVADAERDLVVYEARCEEYEAHIAMLRRRITRIRQQQAERRNNKEST